MKKPWLWFAIALSPLFPAAERPLSSPPGPTPERHRSPADVAVLPGGRLALTANQTADSASLVDLAEGKVLAELPCGRRPTGVACSGDGRRAVVSNQWSGSLSLFEMSGPVLRTAGTVPVGGLP